MPGHVPVLLREVLAHLQLRSGDDVIDGTLGGGGHTRALLDATAPDGRVLAIEADPRTFRQTIATFPSAGSRLIAVQGNFRLLEEYATKHHCRPVAGVLLDLGLATLALHDPGRGFSFQSLGPLDMRLDPTSQTVRAATIVNSWSADQLTELFRVLGGEPAARRLAEAIVTRRTRQPFATTVDLVETVAAVKPRPGRLHPATKVFQALRLAVNDELGALRDVLPQALHVLRSGGRLVVITFQSLEDRLVKQWARQATAAGQARRVTKHVIRPSRAEVLANPRARSAKLRVIAKT